MIAEPHEGIIETLEEYLAMAKSGQLVALGIAGVVSDGTSMPLRRTNFFNRQGFSCQMESAVSQLLRSIGAWMDE